MAVTEDQIVEKYGKQSMNCTRKTILTYIYE